MAVFRVRKGKTSERQTNQQRETHKASNTTTNKTPLVINMSNKTLTEAQISLLKKGLKFTPTPNPDPTQVEIDTKTFCRRLRLKEHFYGTPQEINENTPLVRNKSNWTPQTQAKRTT